MFDQRTKARWTRVQEVYEGSEVSLADLSQDHSHGALVVTWGRRPELDLHRVDVEWLKHASDEEFAVMVEVEETTRRSRLARSASS